MTAERNNISTLAPREGSDFRVGGRLRKCNNFNPRSPRGERPGCNGNQPGGACISTLAPREGSDEALNQGRRAVNEFQPSLPARGATEDGKVIYNLMQFQPSLPARGATIVSSVGAFVIPISTLAPREGSDFIFVLGDCPYDISTLAPREGSDYKAGPLVSQHRHFNPRSPRGERRIKAVFDVKRQKFQPSLPARGATRHLSHQLHIVLISTLAPREGSDDYPELMTFEERHFNPRSPRGERRDAPSWRRWPK